MSSKPVKPEAPLAVCLSPCYQSAQMAPLQDTRSQTCLIAFQLVRQPLNSCASVHQIVEAFVDSLFS